MAGINKVIIVGRLGNAPEMRTIPNGDAVANLSVATSESWTDKQTGESARSPNGTALSSSADRPKFVGSTWKKVRWFISKENSKPANGKTKMGKIAIPQKFKATFYKCLIADKAAKAR